MQKKLLRFSNLLIWKIASKSISVSVERQRNVGNRAESGVRMKEERPDVRAFVKLLKIEDGYAVCDVRFKVVKPDEEQEVTDR